MRVLIVHNRYRLPGGEERSVAEISSLLRRRGHEVELLERDSAAVGGARAARALLAGGDAPLEVAGAARRIGADVVHAHNLQPLFGWRALAAARGTGARTVLHLHNFRLSCAIGVAYRKGRPCHSCGDRNTLPGLIHRCRGSLGEAGVYAAGLALQHPHLLAEADRLVAPSHSHRELLGLHGVPAERVSVLMNFVAEAEWAQASRADAGEYALFAGRLVEEKGADMAIAAARAAGVPLVVAGSGPDEGRLRGLAKGADVRFLGWLDSEGLAGVRERAALLLAPSRWEEVSGFTVLDALASGLPVLASDLGALPELVQPAWGRVLPARDVPAWTAAVTELWGDPEGRRSSGEAALKEARERFGEERAYGALMEIYGGA
jgi:glycosyltransferase involved in cell wall biosynthesis